MHGKHIEKTPNELEQSVLVLQVNVVHDQSFMDRIHNDKSPPAASPKTMMFRDSSLGSNVGNIQKGGNMNRNALVL